jgi:hypothetical protein
MTGKPNKIPDTLVYPHNVARLGRDDTRLDKRGCNEKVDSKVKRRPCLP